MSLITIVTVLLVWLGMPESVAETRAQAIGELVMALIAVVGLAYQLFTGWEDYAKKRDSPAPQVQQQIEQAVEQKVTQQVAQQVQEIREAGSAELKTRLEQAIQQLRQSAGK